MQHFDPSHLVDPENSPKAPVEARASLENPQTSIADPEAWLIHALGGGGPSSSGVMVNARTSLNLAAVYACVRLLAETIGSLPLNIYERVESGGKKLATAHPLYGLLHDEPNEQMSSLIWRETCQGHLGLWGNGYSEIERDGAGEIAAIWPVPADRTTVRRLNGRKIYIFRRPNNEEVTLDDVDVIHVPGLGYDGLIGYSPIDMARQVFGGALATQEFGNRFFANGANASGILTSDHELSDKAFAHLRESFAAKQSGLHNAHKPIILEDGTKWQAVSIPPENAQFLETRYFGIEEICRWYNVPPHMVQHLKDATFSNIENQAIQFVVYSIRPWLVRWEQELNRKLFRGEDRRRYFVQFNADGLLRGDTAARSTFYREQFMIGSITQNEIRALENRNPIPGGDTAYVPLNMISAEAAAKAPAEPAPAQGSSGDGGKGAQRSIELKPIFADALRRLNRREMEVLGRVARRNGGKLPEDFAKTFWPEHRDYVRATLAPVIAAAGGDIEAIAVAYVERASSELAGDESITERLGSWARRIDAEMEHLKGQS